MHPLGSESNFNESMYFNFFDPRRSLGGWMRLGNRANEGYAEMSVCLYLADGRVLFMFDRPKIADNDAFDAGGLRFEVMEPGASLRTSYAGAALELAEPKQMADPREAFKRNPMRKLSFDLVHEAVGPMYGDSGNAGESSAPAEEQFAAAHYEQHMRVSGSLRFESEDCDIEGFGLRDHSWGPRYWQAIDRYMWLTMNFGKDLGAMVSVIQKDAAGENIRIGGVVAGPDEIDDIVSADVRADYEENGLYHRAVTADIVTASGREMSIQGRVRSFIPLRNRREGKVTHIGEGMTEWHCEGRTGYGLSEFLRQIG